MSVVAARVYDDRIELAADTFCLRGASKMNTAEKNTLNCLRLMILL